MKDFLGITETYSLHGPGVDHLIGIVHWFMLALFVGWTAFFLFVLWRFSKRRNPRADYTGVKNHVSTHLEIGVVIIEAVLLLGFAFPMWRERTDKFVDVQAKDPVRVRVIGWQYAWTYHYPGEDGIFGRIDRTLASYPGDPCIDPEDPSGYDDFIVAGGRLQLPEKRPAILMITATDVIHNYAIVPMRIQQDAIPGKDIPMWFTPRTTLETSVVCAQLCGEGHGAMRGGMDVISQASYDTWAAEQSANALKKRSSTEGRAVAKAIQ